MGRNLEAFIMQNYRKALDYHEIQPFYQPVIRTSSRQLCSFEALARWIDPELGIICPDEFIPILEQAGLIHLLDTAILQQVCARIRSSIANGETPIPVSVNLSRLDFTLCDILPSRTASSAIIRFRTISSILKSRKASWRSRRTSCWGSWTGSAARGIRFGWTISATPIRP